MKFKVYESATVVSVYEIEAENSQKAQEIVDEGYTDPVRVEYIDREIYDVAESKDEQSPAR